MTDLNGYPGGQWRKDLLSGRWLVVAPLRGERPRGPNGPIAPRMEPSAETLEKCPFCPGNESEIPEILEETAASDPPGWSSRAVRNRYPAFVGGRDGDDPAEMAIGWQEVLVETPDHRRDWPDLDDDEAARVLALYLRRISEAHRRTGHSVFLFRNRGRDSGSTQSHPHAQLVAVRGVPPAVREREEAQRLHLRRTGECVVCALPTLEPGHERRIVAQVAGSMAVVPWAPSDSFHLRIFPDRHVSSLTALDPTERRALATLLRDLLAALRGAAGDPHYNLLLHDHGPALDPALHAHVEIRTRFTRTAGFELVTGTEIAVSDPARDAEVLRSWLDGR